MAVTEEGKDAIIVLSVLTAVATVTVFFRVRRRWAKAFIGADDWLLLIALLLLYVQDFWGYTFAFKGGEGKPYNTLTTKEIEWFFKCYYFPEIGYCIHVTLIKISILISYKRIFGHISWCRQAIHALTGITLLWFLGSFLTFVFQCSPVYRAYQPGWPSNCFDLEKWLWGTAISNMVIDWMILIIPILPVYNIKARLVALEKALVSASFLMGSLACLASSARAILTHTLDTSDYSAGSFIVSISTYAEPMVAIISACLPFLSLNQFIASIYFTTMRLCGKQPLERPGTKDENSNGPIEATEMHSFYRGASHGEPSPRRTLA